MDKITEYLFGRFPRRVGSPHQWWVFNEEQMDFFLRKAAGSNNLYATVARFELDGTPVSSKVAYDFDSPRKESAFPGVTSDEMRMRQMWEDPGKAEAVLGPPLADARCVVETSQARGIPVATVYTGMGFHVYQLYQPLEDPEDAMRSIASKHRKELELDTSDVRVIGDVQRILRIPNQERICKETGHGTGFYTIPLSPREVMEWDPSRIVDVARFPRTGLTPEVDLGWGWPEERPEMKVEPGYTGRSAIEASTEKELEVPHGTHGEEWARAVLEDLLQMPCMYEHLCQPKPEHPIRVNSAVLLYNAGLQPRDVEDLLMALNFRDQDRQTTRMQTEQIWRGGYADMSCETLRAMGYCTRSEDPKSCPTYGWSGGRADW